MSRFETEGRFRFRFSAGVDVEDKVDSRVSLPAKDKNVARDFARLVEEQGDPLAASKALRFSVAPTFAHHLKSLIFLLRLCRAAAVVLAWLPIGLTLPDEHTSFE